MTLLALENIETLWNVNGTENAQVNLNTWCGYLKCHSGRGQVPRERRPAVVPGDVNNDVRT